MAGDAKSRHTHGAKWKANKSRKGEKQHNQEDSHSLVTFEFTAPPNGDEEEDDVMPENSGAQAQEIGTLNLEEEHLADWEDYDWYRERVRTQAYSKNKTIHVWLGNNNPPQST